MMDHTPGDFTRPARNLGRLNVCCLLAFGALRNVERYFLAFLEGLESGHADCRKMRKQIIAAIFRGNEAKAF